jgi:hypothetical protein
METLLGIVALICAIFVIFQVWTKQPTMGVGEKLIWTIAALLFSILTAIIFYFMRMK